MMDVLNMRQTMDKEDTTQEIIKLWKRKYKDVNKEIQKMYRINTAIDSELVLTKEKENEDEELAAVMAIELERYHRMASPAGSDADVVSGSGGDGEKRKSGNNDDGSVYEETIVVARYMSAEI